MSIERQNIIEQAMREAEKMYPARNEAAAHVERALVRYDISRGKNVMPNTHVLCFVLGWQGGTIHQVAKLLGVTTSDICNADYDRMGDLCRMAQEKRKDGIPA